MEELKLVISRKAALTFYRTGLWYQLNRGWPFAETYEANIEETISLIRRTPSVGKIIKEKGGKTYRFFIAHPLTKIFYWYNDKEVHISEIVSTRMS